MKKLPGDFLFDRLCLSNGYPNEEIILLKHGRFLYINQCVKRSRDWYIFSVSLLRPNAFLCRSLFLSINTKLTATVCLTRTFQPSPPSTGFLFLNGVCLNRHPAHLKASAIRFLPFLNTGPIQKRKAFSKLIRWCAKRRVDFFCESIFVEPIPHVQSADGFNRSSPRLTLKMPFA